MPRWFQRGKPGGRPVEHSRREIVDAPVYWLPAGRAWRLLPHDLPPWQTIHRYWRWRIEAIGNRS